MGRSNLPHLLRGLREWDRLVELCRRQLAEDMRAERERAAADDDNAEWGGSGTVVLPSEGMAAQGWTFHACSCREESLHWPGNRLGLLGLPPLLEPLAAAGAHYVGPQIFQHGRNSPPEITARHYRLGVGEARDHEAFALLFGLDESECDTLLWPDAYADGWGHGPKALEEATERVAALKET